MALSQHMNAYDTLLNNKVLLLDHKKKASIFVVLLEHDKEASIFVVLFKKQGFCLYYRIINHDQFHFPPTRLPTMNNA
jgi:hypothetical protein